MPKNYNDLNSGNPSAPVYDPDAWNDRSTPEKREAFFQENRAAIVAIAATRITGYPPTAENRAQFEKLAEDEKDHMTRSAVELFYTADQQQGGNDARLARQFGLNGSAIPALRSSVTAMREQFGYQDFANCYTYAMNDKDGINSPDRQFGGDHPGVRASTDPRLVDHAELHREAKQKKDYPRTKKELMAGVIADGALPGGMDAQPREGYYRVGVYAMPPEKMPKSESDSWTDMHFVREDKDGGFSHKRGSNPVTNKDIDGNPMTDLKTANLGGYEFLGYVYVPEGGLDVGRKGEPKAKPGSVDVPKSSSSLDPTANQIAVVPYDPLVAYNNWLIIAETKASTSVPDFQPAIRPQSRHNPSP